MIQFFRDEEMGVAQTRKYILFYFPIAHCDKQLNDQTKKKRSNNLIISGLIIVNVNKFEHFVEIYIII